MLEGPQIPWSRRLPYLMEGKSARAVEVPPTTALATNERTTARLMGLRTP